MFSRNRARNFLIAMLTALFLAGCGGGSDVEPGSVLLTCDLPLVPDASGGSCVAPPPIQCDPPTVPDARNESCVVGADPTAPPPVAKPGVDQAVLYYNRAAVDADNSSNDPVYEGWRLHTWSNATCDAYADPDTEWANGRIHDGIDPNYGAYWIVDLKPGYAGTEGACGNFIIHIGTEDSGKELGGSDFQMPLSQDDPDFTRMNFTFSGVASVFEFPIVSLGPQPVKIDGQAAHWLDMNTLLWSVDTDTVASVKLHYSAAADLEADVDTGLNGTAIDLIAVDLTDEQAAIAPHLSSMNAFQGEWTADDAKAVLKAQAVLAGYNADGDLVSATGIQLANGIDQVYTAGEADANEAQLGPIYADGAITASVWAPTAQNVQLKLYGSDKRLTSTQPMTEDPVTGIWSYTGGQELDRQLYRYEVTVYHPKATGIQILDVTDPYSVSLSTNSRFSQFVNLADEDLKPDGWDTHDIPTIANFEDAVIYEGHIRDFSVLDESTSAANRGKYMAFTEDGSLPVEHLRKLAETGVTHFHMLPANDIATIEEDPSNSVDLNSTFGDLCNLNRRADICQDASISDDMLLIDLYQSFGVGEGLRAQELTEALRGYDQFNWGYDPYHFNVPEGSYASDAEGVARIVEMRAMNMALHGLGLRVALDVVYNHTNASELNTRSVLDKVVPGYYHRYEVDTGAIVRETCCDDTEPRNVMMEKLMEDSLVLWASEYKFDSFRFDIMSQATKATMVRLFEAIQEIDEDTYFYGEGWTREDRGYEQANQPNMAGTEIGTFNDRIREAVRQGNIFKREADNASMGDQDRVKMSMAGTLTDFILEDFNGVASTTSAIGGYATDPADIINYVSKHDNETLWDQFQYVLPEDLTLAERVRAQNVAATLPLVSQGIPFLQMGGDFLRSKSMDRNTFDAGDWFNYVDFTMQTNNWNVGLPLAQDNQSRWEEMQGFFAAPERAASMTEIEFASAVFDEILSIRSDSPLFRLTSGADVLDRVGFHNIGRRQTNGLIVMSIDDGVSGDEDAPRADLDPMNDALVVVVNTSYEALSHTVPTAAGFELHMTQMGSIDPTVRGASFSAGEGEGTFTVPALTTAVFVKPQMGAQGEGLSAIATSGAPDVVPYGSTGVFLRGTMFDWANPAPAEAQFEYQGDGIYSMDIELTEGVAQSFKVARGDWDNGDESLDLGATSDADNTLTLAEELVLAENGGPNLAFTADVTTVYTFTLDASDTTAPLLTIDYEEPYFGSTLLIRGSMNGWGETDPMSYEVGGIYSATLDLPAGENQFKVATGDWETVNFGTGESSQDVTLTQDKLLGGGDNLILNIDDAGQYSFIFNASDLEEPLVTVFSAQFFADTPVFIRGSMNGWGESDAVSYDGDGQYSAEIALDAGSYEFKVASSDWATFNLGGATDGTTTPLDTKVGTVQNGSNLVLEIPANGTYEFKVTGPNPNFANVTVSEKP